MMARWRLNEHDFAGTRWLELRRYDDRDDPKLSVSQLYSNPRGPGYWKTICFDWWDFYQYPEALDFLIETLTEWRAEIKRRKGGKRNGDPCKPHEEMAK